MKKNKVKNTVNIQNKKASYEYEFLIDEVAGISLVGSEIKPIRSGKASITESYCYIQAGEVYITGMYVAEHKESGRNNHEPYRLRKLLLTKKQIKKFENELKIKGRTIVPVKLFTNERGVLKLKIALAKGKKTYEKRASIKERDVKRDMDREINS
jgi:SsrA-binding protein